MAHGSLRLPLNWLIKMVWKLNQHTYITDPNEKPLAHDDMAYYRHIRAKDLERSERRVEALRTLFNRAGLYLLDKPCPNHPEHRAVCLGDADGPISYLGQDFSVVCPIRMFLMKGRVLIWFGGWQEWLATEPLKAILQPMGGI